MAFSYAPSAAPMSGLSSVVPIAQAPRPLNYGAPLQSRVDYGGQQQLDYSNQFPAQQQQQQSIDPQQMYKLYQQFAGSGASSSGGNPALSGLLSTGGGTSAGLGGSGLIGSAGGATSAASTGGASFGLGGSLVGGSGAVGGSTFAAGAGSTAGGLGGALGGGGAAAGGAAGGGAAAGGMGGAAAAGGPWAALAAIIMINEEDSRKKGLRSENRGQRTKDQLDGKVLTQDIEGKWGPMFDKWTGGNFSKLGFQGDAKGGSQIASGRIGPGIKSLWNEGTVGKIRKLF